MNVRRAIEAVVICIAITLVLLTRITPREAMLFGATLLLIYLPGYIIINYIMREKFDAVEAHLFSFSLGISTISFASFAAISFELPVNMLTVIGIETAVLFVLGHVVWLKKLASK